MLRSTYQSLSAQNGILELENSTKKLVYPYYCGSFCYILTFIQFILYTLYVTKQFRSQSNSNC